MPPSAVSKLVTRLEARLGSRLVNRSTRAFQLTPEGRVFYERAARILPDIEDAERNVGAGEEPVGRLVPVLDDLNPGDREAFHAIHIGQGGPLPSLVRALLDFLGEHGKVG